MTLDRITLGSGAELVRGLGGTTGFLEAARVDPGALLALIEEAVDHLAADGVLTVHADQIPVPTPEEVGLELLATIHHPDGGVSLTIRRS